MKYYRPAGRKYVTALAWGVHVVNTNWLFDSINAKGNLFSLLITYFKSVKCWYIFYLLFNYRNS